MLDTPRLAWYIGTMIDFGIFQLLPPSPSHSDRAVIEQALWEARFADANGFESVWIAEHHGSEIGLVSAPSVYAAAVAMSTRRIRIGYAVAVVPLHQPLRLAEEIAWVDALSGGRVVVGVGPGFSASEFAMYGVPLEERHARFEEGLRIIRAALAGDEIRPRPASMPQIYRACSSAESVRRAADEGTPVLLGQKADAELIALHDDVTVLRPIDLERNTPEEVLRELETLAAFGARRVIGWFHVPGVSFESVRRSMELAAAEVIPHLRRSSPWQSSSSASRPASGWRSAS